MRDFEAGSGDGGGLVIDDRRAQSDVVERLDALPPQSYRFQEGRISIQNRELCTYPSRSLGTGTEWGATWEGLIEGSNQRIGSRRGIGRGRCRSREPSNHVEAIATALVRVWHHSPPGWRHGLQCSRQVQRPRSTCKATKRRRMDGMVHTNARCSGIYSPLTLRMTEVGNA